MADKKRGDDEDIEIVSDNDDEGEVVTIEEGKEKPKAKAKEGDKEDSPGNEGEEEERVVGHSQDEEGEDTPPKRKSSRFQRAKASRARDKRELEYLRIRNQQLEDRFGELEVRTATNEAVAIDARIQALQSQIATADEVIAAAIEQNSGKDHVEATRIRERLVRNLERLTEAKSQIESKLEEPNEESRSNGQRQVSRVPPEILANAKVWREENPWWKPGSKDKDSSTVARLDRQIANEGYDPKSEEYWEELTRRTKKALPHRFEETEEEEIDEEDDPPPKKKKNGSGPRFSTGGREGSLKPNQVHISAERKAAMIEAGVWHDQKLRARYLKSYQKYDRQAAGHDD